MRSPLRIASVLALVGLAAWGAKVWLWPDEAARVRAAARELAEAVTAVGGSGGGLELVGALGALRPLLDEAVSVEAPDRGVRVAGRDQVLGLASRFAGVASRPALSLDDVQATVGDDGREARVVATATWRGRGDGQETIDAMEVELEFVRAGRQWVLRGARTVDVLR